MTEESGSATGGTTGSPSAPAATTPSGVSYTTPDHVAGPSVNATATPGHHNALAHHSTMSSSPSGSSSGVSKTNPAAKDKKGKPKLSPEQKAQLQAIEKKQEEERRARCVRRAHAARALLIYGGSRCSERNSSSVYDLLWKPKSPVKRMTRKLRRSNNGSAPRRMT